MSTEPKKEKTEQQLQQSQQQSGNGTLSSDGNLGSGTAGNQGSGGGPPQYGDQQKPNRPNTLDASRMLTRRMMMLGNYLHKMLFNKLSQKFM